MQKENTLKDFIDSEEYILRNKKLQEEINAFPVNIDYSCFKKTPQEKMELKELKANYKLNKNKNA